MTAPPKPLLVGRFLRIGAGLACFYLIFEVMSPRAGLGQWSGAIALALLGVSFVVGGFLANPGCEVTVLPNLILKRKAHFF